MELPRLWQAKSQMSNSPPALWGQTPVPHISLQHPSQQWGALPSVSLGAAEPPPPPRHRNSSCLHNRGWTALYITLNYSLGKGRETKQL